MDRTSELQPDAEVPAPHRRRRSRWYGVVAVVTVAGVLVWWFAVRSDGSASVSTTTTQDLVTVTRGPLTSTVSAEGTVAAADTDDLSFGASGTVTAVNVLAGDAVVAGQVLATLDSASLQADVASAESDLADAEATLADDQASGASSTQVAVDQTRVQTAVDALADAEEALAGANLVATFDGTVAVVNVSVGEQLGSGSSGGSSQTGSDSGTGDSSSNLGNGASGAENGASTADIQVVSTGRYTSELQVDSSNVDDVDVGAAVTVTLATRSSSGAGGFFPGGGFGPTASGPITNGNGNATSGNGTSGPDTTGSGASATGTTVTGTVTKVGRVADASSGVAQYPVTITFATDDSAFAVGASISGAIATSVVDDVLQVPVRAVTTQDGTSTVTVALDGTTDGRTEERTVTTGASAGGQIAITDGLEEGEQVIVETVVITGGGSDGGGNGELPTVGQLPGGVQLPAGGQFPGGGQLPAGRTGQ